MPSAAGPRGVKEHVGLDRQDQGSEGLHHSNSAASATGRAALAFGGGTDDEPSGNLPAASRRERSVEMEDHEENMVDLDGVTDLIHKASKQFLFRLMRKNMSPGRARSQS